MIPRGLENDRGRVVLWRGALCGAMRLAKGEILTIKCRYPVHLRSTKAFGQLVTLLDIPLMILDLFSTLKEHPWLVMLLIGFFYILIGMWLKSIPQIIIYTAVFLPLVTELGIDPILFGVFTVMTCEIGFLTPPIGINLFVAARITNVTVEEISLGVLPLLIPYVLMIILLAFFSGWVTFLPDLVYGPRAY